MSLHKLAEVTITVEGLPEYCGTDEELQELIEEAEALLDSMNFVPLLLQQVADELPHLAYKIRISIKGP